ncbi:uncharacterized protein LOC114517000 isoform X2 [Dendronephthya gigantea]|uniref:uncharacterized protein LOC114517000 isoform X2 n=1 Tax=Dendronephthya gigantea TaxID=151771 RepID=UPI00106A3B8D|nr:uncharacterized protein LOC114517000 isoform X2 [Dendronephthya gigantea]
MKNFNGSHIIFLLFICALAKEVAESVPICLAGTYYTEDIFACVACPVRGRCDDQYYRAVNRCKEACEKKATLPPSTPTTEVQKHTASGSPTIEVEIFSTTSEEGETIENGTSRGDTKVVDFAENPGTPSSKSSSSVLPIIIAVLGTLLLCAIIVFVYKKVDRKKVFSRQETSSEEEPINAPGSSGPDDRSTEKERTIVAVYETKEAERIRLTEAELKQYFVSNLHLDETEV